jgi:hypothetical protein
MSRRRVSLFAVEHSHRSLNRLRHANLSEDDVWPHKMADRCVKNRVKIRVAVTSLP